MIRKTFGILLIGMVAWGGLSIGVQADQTASCKVLVVLTYAEDFFWSQDIKTGIDAVLEDQCEIRYMALDALKDPDGVDAKVQEAYAAYQEWQPDGIITADDDVQAKLVVPYFKDKVETPVIFCGVNGEPEDYGFPASNVSGIVQRPHVKDTVLFVRQFDPSIQTIGMISTDIPTARALSQQIEQEKDTYGVEMLEPIYVSTLDEALAAVEDLKAQSDALFVGPLGNLLDADGKALTDKDVDPIVTEAFGKPTLATRDQFVEYGVLCAITDRGEEQGQVAADMLLKAMQGTPMSELQITRNKKGKRVLNVTTMKALGLTPKPTILKGVELVETAQ